MTTTATQAAQDILDRLSRAASLFGEPGPDAALDTAAADSRAESGDK